MLEDFHGYNYYGGMPRAFDAYYQATKKLSQKDRDAPEFDMTYEESYELLKGMLKHYENWLYQRDPLQTYWLDGVPQVEVKFQIPIPFDTSNTEYDEVVYEGKLDRVVIDEYGGLWIVEYKSARQFDVLKLDTDAQVSAYCWAGNLIYDRPIQGVIYQQHRKDVPSPPKLLRSGKFSANKDQLTTWHLYNKSLQNLYGDPSKAPEDNIICLNHLADLESENHDKYIRRDQAPRNQHQIEAEGFKIMLELEEMLNPNISCYPNPTWDCAYDCKDFIMPCIMLDSGDDWTTELESATVQRTPGDDAWRKYLPIYGEGENNG